MPVKDLIFEPSQYDLNNVLADAEAIRRYDLLHRGAGPKDTDIARPAEFLIDSSGTIRWVNLTENIAVRARPEQLLEAFEQTEQPASH